MKRMMKYVMAATVAAMTLAFQSCGDKDEPVLPVEPEEVVYTYNKNDSAAFCDIFMAAYNGYSGTIQMEYRMRLDSIPSWHPFVEWVKDEDKKEARISSLKIKAWDTDIYYGILSYQILNLDSLKNLEISGTGIHGYVPSVIGTYYSLERLSIVGTSITYFPGRIFNSPKLKELTMTQNYKMELPDLDYIEMGWGESYASEDFKPKRLWLMDNGFEGTCPLSLRDQVNFDMNNFTAVDWEGMEDKNYKELFKVSPLPGPFLMNNKNLKATVPDYILSDTLAMIYVSHIFSGSGQIEKLPSQEEIYKMKVEWKEHHPEEAEEMVSLY